MGEGWGEGLIIMKKETVKWVIQLIVSILTAVVTTLGTTSCMNDPHPALSL